MYQMEHFFGGAVNNNNWLTQTFLFKSIDAKDTEALVQNLKIEYKEYKKGDDIYLPNAFESKIGFVVEGQCRVEKIRENGNHIPLNTLNPHDSFGVLAVFTGRDEFPTGIVATASTKIAYIDKENLINLMKKSVQFSLNIINFLSNRINFLCDKIYSFTGDNVEQKLAIYIFDIFKKTGSINLKLNKKHAAESLNIGRTSLYRALDELASSGIIEITEKNIIIHDLEGLERKTK